MEGKSAQKSTLKSNYFQIPIEDYEKEMESELSKEKKKEILELFTTYNKLRSEKEFNKINYDLYFACRTGDLEMIKILLSETIKNSSEGLTFKIDPTNKTASLFKVKKNIEELIIPRTVEHNSTEYLITSIYHTGENVETIKFSEDSSVQTFYRDAFSYSKIESIYFPASLKELKERWCCGTDNLKKIIISPSNGQFKFEDDKYLISKSDSNNDEFDTLLFVRRDIKEFSIPSNIKIISSYAFYNCCNLIKVEIPTNSNLQTIGKFAFSGTNIESIFIPSKVTKICEDAFYNCQNLIKVEIPTNSNLQTIESFAFSSTKIESIYFPASLKELKEGWLYRTNNLKKIIISQSNDQFKFEDDRYLISKSDINNTEFDTLLFVRRDIKEFSIPSNIKIISSYAFSRSNIETIFIPSKVTKICENAFFDCENLTKVEIPTNSNLQIIESSAFSSSRIESIYIPSKVTKICENAFFDCENLTKVEIPTNSNLQIIESGAFLGLSIETIFIPSKVTKICELAFSDCYNLKKVEIPTNSNLQTIESNAFTLSKIESIYFPAGLKELKEGWCYRTYKLKKIIISQSNGQFKFIDNKYLLGKSDPNNDEFDTLLFVRRDIKEFSIPSNIKIISSYAFDNCCNLKKVEIPTNSNLQTIGKFAFSGTNIESFYIPSKLSKICENAFYECENLQIIEISEESKLKSLSSTFDRCKKPIIVLPSSLRELINSNEPI